VKFSAGRVQARWTGRRDGDLGPADFGGGSETLGRPPRPAGELERRRRAIVDRSWSWVTQVHGAGVVVVREPGDGGGGEGDALVSDHPACCLAVFTADCAPIALASPEGVLGAVHAGWRGLAAGVVASAAGAMRHLGATRIEAALGPCIHPECYEFSSEDLDRVADRLGPTVRGITTSGRPAFDLPRAVRASLRAADVELVVDEDICTACSPHHFSYRARGERQRMALVVWPA
jgi:YfiH family protein